MEKKRETVRINEEKERKWAVENRRCGKREPVEKSDNETGKESRSMENEKKPAGQDGEECERPEVSPAVIRRLPRYFRYLRMLIRQGRMRISSGEFSRMMHLTASQIRQDLNCFGGFGQQGYGYNVDYLYAKICELLGVEAGLHAIVIGAGDMGRALVHSPVFEKRGIRVLALFDLKPDLIGRDISGVRIYDAAHLEDFCHRNHVDFAVLTLPKDQAPAVAKRLTDCGVYGFWNFTGRELESENPNVVVENVHLGDSLMALSYRLCRKHMNDEKTNGIQTPDKG